VSGTRTVVGVSVASWAAHPGFCSRGRARRLVVRLVRALGWDEVERVALATGLDEALPVSHGHARIGGSLSSKKKPPTQGSRGHVAVAARAVRRNSRRPEHTTFSLDGLGRDTCSTWSEAAANRGSPVVVVVVGAGVYGTCCAAKLFRVSKKRGSRLTLDCSLVPQHVQNLPNRPCGSRRHTSLSGSGLAVI
jgi:hypothetical protein